MTTCPVCGAHLDSMSERCNCDEKESQKPVTESSSEEPADAVEIAWEEYRLA